MNRVSQTFLLPLLFLGAFEAASQDYILFTNVARVGTNFQFQLVTTNNSTCDIQYVDRLGSGDPWTNLFSTTGSTNINVPIEAPMRFFRAQSGGSVYSVNAIGYVNLPIPVGYTMIANPLVAAGSNTLSNVMPSPPNGTQFLRWNGAGFDTATFLFGAWDSDYALVPTQGGFINTDMAFTNTFVGEVRASASYCIPSGYSIWSSPRPQATDVDFSGLGRVLNNFDQILVWTNNPPPGLYVVYTLTFGAWDPVTPQIYVGQSVLINSGSGGCYPPLWPPYPVLEKLKP